METTSATRKLSSRPGQAAGCAGSKAQPPQVRTATPVANGFLRQSFSPMFTAAQELPKQASIEKGFFKSLFYLIEHYGLVLDDFSQLPYPYNILMAERETARKLRTRGRYRQLFILQEEKGQTCLSVRESFNHDFGLYYIPVMPIYDLWQNPRHQKCGELLTAVCAYLYAEAGVSYNRDEDTYMYYNYEFLEEWINERQFDSDSEDDYCKQKADYDNAALQGDFIQEKMMANGFRQSLGSLIVNFNAVSDYEKHALRIARAAWALWQAFPNMNLYQHASLQDDEPDDYDDNYIGMHEYFSFVGSINDTISEDLKNMVNDDFNERSRYQEPEVIALFNEPKAIYGDELAYEEKLFALIGDLCTLLYHEP